GLIASVETRVGSPCQQDHGDGDSQAAKTMTCPIPDLPEDILHHIHSLLPLRDAARAACLSCAFLSSWKCHPVLVLNRDIPCSSTNPNTPSKNFKCMVDSILRSHSGIGIKIFKLELIGIYYTFQYLDSWLPIAVTPGIEEFTLNLYERYKVVYNVPCTLFSNGVRHSLQDLQLSSCAFHPTAELGPLRNLTSLSLSFVSISEDELECFLSNSPALKQLYLSGCQNIVCLKIPSVMLQLHSLNVSCSFNMQVIESKAPNLSSFDLLFGESVTLSLGETLQMKKLSMQHSNLVCYARRELASSMPNLERLSISSRYERVDTPMLPTKFLFLKWLAISLQLNSSYDYFSLVSFLDASPSLETLSLDVAREGKEYGSIFGGSPQLRQMPEHHHACLKRVQIKGFNSAKALVELTCYILENAVLLDRLTLDTTYGEPRCDNSKFVSRCLDVSKGFLVKASRGAAAIRTYIKDKVPPKVKLTIEEHCKWCHADSLSKIDAMHV
ncbi:hypothetical protein BS78_09G201300, partial [Paspalum vaginatum]